MSSRRVCKGCARERSVEVRQVRIYSRSKQYRFRMVLCTECYGGLFDLLKESAEGFEEGLWSPLPTEVGGGVGGR